MIEGNLGLSGNRHGAGVLNAGALYAVDTGIVGLHRTLVDKNGGDEIDESLPNGKRAEGKSKRRR